MNENPRARRLADRIQTIVATMIDTRIKDPRLGFVTVTDVRVTGDLQHATIFYTVYGDEKAEADSAAALKSAKGMIRSEVGKQTGLRLTPSLEFVRDAVPENARSIEELLSEARMRDEELARTKQGATPAGEADPYRAPRDASDADVRDADGDDDATEVDLEDDSQQ